MAAINFGPTPGAMPSGAIAVPVGTDLQALVDASPAGTVFWIESGVHRLESVTPKDGQQFIGEAGAVLSGARVLSDFTNEGGAWSVGGQTQEGLRNAADEATSDSPRGGYPDAVYLDDKPLTPVASLSDLGAGKFYFDYEADRIYLGDDPTGHLVEAAVRDAAFKGTATGVVVQDLTIEKYASPIQSSALGGNASPHGWLVQDNEVRLNYGIGIGVGTDSQALGNYVHDNGNMGMSGVGDNILVQGNEIAHNGYWSGIEVLWEGGGAKFAITHDLVVRDNYSHDNNGFGLWTDIDNVNTLYEGNYVANNNQGGINHEISYDAVIRNNVLVGNGADPSLTWLWGGGIQLQDSQNVQIYGNTVDMSSGGNGIGLIEQGRGTGAYGEYKTANNSVHDNIIISGGSDSGQAGLTTDEDSAAVFSQGNTFDGNHYYVTNAVDQHWVWDDEYSFAQFQASTGQEATGTVSTDIPVVAAAPTAVHDGSAPPVGGGTATGGGAAPEPVPTPAPTPVPVDPPAPEIPVVDDEDGGDADVPESPAPHMGGAPHWSEHWHHAHAFQGDFF